MPVMCSHMQSCFVGQCNGSHKKGNLIIKRIKLRSAKKSAKELFKKRINSCTPENQFFQIIKISASRSRTHSYTRGFSGGFLGALLRVLYCRRVKRAIPHTCQTAFC